LAKQCLETPAIQQEWYSYTNKQNELKKQNFKNKIV
jgi:hypothetical protein